MKQLLLSLFILCSAANMSAQCTMCTPSNIGCKPTGGLCNKPATGMANKPYTTTIHFSMPQKLNDPATLAQCSGCSYVQLNRIKITSVTGLPAGADSYTFSKTQAPYKGYYDVQNGDSLGCVTICGTPLAAGLYVIQVNIDADVVAKSVPVVGDVTRNDQPQKYNDTILILPDTSGSVGSFTFGGVKEDCDSVKLNLNAILSAPAPNPTQYFWNINGTSSNQKTPGSVTFNQPGIYPVSLKTVYYQYVLKTIHVSNVTGGYCGDIEEPFCATSSPELYAKVGILGVNTKGNTISATTNIDITIPPASNTLVLGTSSVSFELWDLDNGSPLGSPDDNLGTWSVNIGQSFTYPYQVNFGGGNAQGYVVIDTIAGASIVDTLKVNIKGRPTKPIAFAEKDSVCLGDSIRLSATPYCANCTYEWYKNDTVYLVGVTDSFYYAKVSGGYKLKVTNQSTGCSSVSDSSTRVHFGANPPGSIAFASILYDAGTNVLFLNPGFSSSFKGKWFKDGLEVPGQTGTTIPFLGDGAYQVQVYNPSFPLCAVSTAIDTVTVTPSGIEDARTMLQSLSVTPNPSTGKFVVSLATLASEASIAVNDLVGRTIYSSTLTMQNNSAEKTIDLSGSAKGVYLLNVEIKGKHLVKKLVVE